MRSHSQLPESPPPEVHREIAAASAACDELDATGHRVHFDLARNSQKVSVELRDLRGNQLSALSPADALQLAAEWLC